MKPGNTKADRYEGDPRWRCDPGTTWARWRGRGARGTQPRAVTDDYDLKLAVSELDAGREMLREAHAIANRRAREEAIKVALGRLALASRAIDEVVIRRGGICGDQLP